MMRSKIFLSVLKWFTQEEWLSSVSALRALEHSPEEGRWAKLPACLFVYLSVVMPSPILWTTQVLASGALFKVVAEEWFRVTSQTRTNCYEQAPFLLSIPPQISIYYFHFRMNKDKFWSSSATITNTKRWSFHSELSHFLDFMAYLKDLL